MAGRHTSASLRRRAGDAVLSMKNMIRRVVATATGRVWQAAGVQDPLAAETVAAMAGFGGVPMAETFPDVETFGTAGFYSRPGVGTAEAIIVHVGGSDDHPVIIGTKDRSLEVELLEGEAIMNISGAAVKITMLGKVELNGPAGLSLIPPAGVATGVTRDSWGVPLFAGGVSIKVFSG